jgi:outer membrane immunogenic protein
LIWDVTEMSRTPPAIAVIYTVSETRYTGDGDMKKILLATVALTALVAAPAMAADLARPVYKAAPPPVVYAYSWTGCYVGGNGGGVWVHKDYALTGVGIAGFGGVNFPAIGMGSHDASSGIGGVQVGCNYQFAGGWVIGIQADYDWMRANGSHTDPFTNLTTLTNNAKSLGSVTGRIGYAWDRFLGYVKGGGAWERDDYAWFFTAAPGVALTGSETRGGWTVGIGGEYAFTDWLTGFAEYDYYGFGTRTVGLTFSPLTANFDIKENKSVAKVGLNFKFGGSPVVAKY